MPENIKLSDLVPQPKAAENPRVATDELRRGGGRPPIPPPAMSNWLSHSQVSRAPAPLLRFTDLISGPATGLGDGLGSGVIVTVWGQGLGDSQGDSQVFFTDSLGVSREAAHVYYWKRADGQLPSGPARLWYSHLMQEIAFSIPAGSASGLGQITIERNGQTSNTLPFTVRDGNIYHVRSTGSDAGTGTYEDPWLNVTRALRTQEGGQLAPAGSTIYMHDVNVGDPLAAVDRALYWNNADATSTIHNQFATLAYPGHQPLIAACRAVENFNTSGWVVSKLDILASNYLAVDHNDQPIGTPIQNRDTYCYQSAQWGRAVANRMTDLPGACADGQMGAIYGNRHRIDGFKALGNEVYAYGCAGSTKFHHTTYMSIRGDGIYDPWEWQWNFLHENKVKQGIHNWDNDNFQSNLTGPIIIRNNVIVRQAGAAMDIGGGAPWTFDTYMEDNILIDIGRAAAWDGVDPATSSDPEGGGIYVTAGNYSGTVYSRRNFIYKWGVDGAEQHSGALSFGGNGGEDLHVVHSENVMITEIDRNFVGSTIAAQPKLNQVSGNGNCWYFASEDSPTNAVVPAWDVNPITASPQITLDGCIVSLGAGSALIGKGTHTEPDIYGVPRPTQSTTGPVEYIE